MVITPKQKIILLYNPKMKPIEKSLVNLIDKIASFYKIKGIILNLYIGFEKGNSGNTGSLIQYKFNHNEFILHIEMAYGRKEVIKSFLHEFKHIQQYHHKKTKTFVRKGINYFQWKNEVFLFNKLQNKKLTEWNQLPWEIEAQKAELNYPKFKDIISLKDWHYMKKLEMSI